MSRLIPSRRQWQSWTLPSKLTAIGVLLGALGLLATVSGFFITERSEETNTGSVAPQEESLPRAGGLDAGDPIEVDTSKEPVVENAAPPPGNVVAEERGYREDHEWQEILDALTALEQKGGHVEYKRENIFDRVYLDKPSYVLKEIWMMAERISSEDATVLLMLPPEERVRWSGVGIGDRRAIEFRKQIYAFDLTEIDEGHRIEFKIFSVKATPKLRL